MAVTVDAVEVLETTVGDVAWRRSRSRFRPTGDRGLA